MNNYKETRNHYNNSNTCYCNEYCDNKLYQDLNQTLNVLQEFNEFTVTSSFQGNDMVFGIATPYPHALPNALGELFFDMPVGYDVKINETSKCVYNIERYFEVQITARANDN